MRFLVAVVVFSGAAFAQNLTEFGAAAAVGSAGGVGGKGVSEGLTAVFGKVGAQTAKAARTAEKAPADPALELAPGVVREETGGVPLPPPSAGKRTATPPALPALAALPEEVEQLSSLAIAPVLPPPPEMSPAGLKTVAQGMSRAEVLKLGAPASKLTMWENGHLSETYSYRQQGRKIGTVHLTDGAVAGVDIQ